MKSSGKIQSILVGVDFSKYSKSAVLQARLLAKTRSLPLTFVYVFDGPISGEQRYQSVVAHHSEYYKKRVNRVYKVQRHEAVVVKYGRTFEQILMLAGKLVGPLIVLGHRGDRGMFSKLFIGSTAERVAQKSTHPVWIHRGKKQIQLNKVLIPCDLSDRAPFTVQFLKKNGFGKTKLELFHAIVPPMVGLDYDSWKASVKEATRLNAEKFKKFKKKYPTLKISEAWGSAFDEVERRSKSFDVIALSPRSTKSFFQGFGSVTSKIVRASRKPVLVIP